MIKDKIVFNNGYDIYTDDEGWLGFLSSVSYFYAGKPKQLPAIRLHLNEELIQSSIEKTIEDLYEVTNADSFSQDLITFYGKTYDLNEAGYILEDGTCLDFSGRHLKYGLIKWEYVEGKKGITHDTVLGINNDNYCLTDDYRELLWSSLTFTQAIMNNCHAVRVGVGYEDIEPFIQVVSPLTESQIASLVDQLEGQKIIVDCITEKNLPVFDNEIVVSAKSLRNFNDEMRYHGIK